MNSLSYELVTRPLFSSDMQITVRQTSVCNSHMLSSDIESGTMHMHVFLVPIAPQACDTGTTGMTHTFDTLL